MGVSNTTAAGHTPDTVRGAIPRGLYNDAWYLRAQIKVIADRVDELRQTAARSANQATSSIEQMQSSGVNTEVVANATLVYRHLEDASMRLGKMLQALDGGVSVYDKATTVGTGG